MNNQHDVGAAWAKMAAAWVLTLAGGVTLQTAVQLAALVYTLLQIYLLVRDKIVRRRQERETQRGGL